MGTENVLKTCVLHKYDKKYVFKILTSFRHSWYKHNVMIFV
jgi:hypothetical protein